MARWPGTFATREHARNNFKNHTLPASGASERDVKAGAHRGKSCQAVHYFSLFRIPRVLANFTSNAISRILQEFNFCSAQFPRAHCSTRFRKSFQPGHFFQCGNRYPPRAQFYNKISSVVHWWRLIKCTSIDSIHIKYWKYLLRRSQIYAVSTICTAIWLI